MTTSTIRFAIIVALVVVGVVLIDRFPQSSTGTAAGTRSPTPSESSNSSGQNHHNNGGQQSTSLQGVKVAVYNGTTQTGLAAGVATLLIKKFGVKINSSNSILNAPSIPFPQTTIYFVASTDKPAAQALATSFFKKLPSPPKVQALPSNTTAPPGVQLAVYLGTDYVNA